MKPKNQLTCMLGVLGLVVIHALAGCNHKPASTPAELTPLVSATAPESTQVKTLEAQPSLPPAFDGKRAYEDVATQVDFGPRTPGSQGHDLIRGWLVDELVGSDWDVEIQQGTVDEKPVKNIIAHRGTGQPWVIIGAHYDTRIYADRDPDPEKRDEPVPGANDGASGVAVLLELARVLPDDFQGQISLVFFDAEDNGEIDGWDWIMGSTYFVGNLTEKPDAVVVVDMIGDADLNIFMERSSDLGLTAELWSTAKTLGYNDYFIPASGSTIIDDHTPFLREGIKAVDIIDFDYSYWHTVGDTLDKVSPHSLQVVGDVVLTWLMTRLGI